VGLAAVLLCVYGGLEGSGCAVLLSEDVWNEVGEEGMGLFTVWEGDDDHS